MDEKAERRRQSLGRAAQRAVRAAAKLVRKHGIIVIVGDMSSGAASAFVNIKRTSIPAVLAGLAGQYRQYLIDHPTCPNCEHELGPIEVLNHGAGDRTTVIMDNALPKRWCEHCHNGWNVDPRGVALDR